MEVCAQICPCQGHCLTVDHCHGRLWRWLNNSLAALKDLWFSSQLGTRAPAEPNLRILKGPPGSQPRFHGAMVLFCHLATCLSKLIAAALTALQQNSRASNPRMLRKRHFRRALMTSLKVAGAGPERLHCFRMLQGDSVNCSNILYYTSSKKVATTP